MKNRLFLCGFLLSIYLSAPFSSAAQLAIPSTDGYSVNIMVMPTAIVPASHSCTWGYNYEVRMNYVISFSGSNIPASLYTLQGFIGCNNNTSNYFDLPNDGGIGTVTSTSNQWTSTSDCNTATVLSLGCKTANIQIHGPGINDRTVSFPISYSVLSVTLLDFSVVRAGNKVELDWKTATETNNAFFAIERSADGTNWTEIKRINASGNSANILSYKYTDEMPFVTVAYYRLKMIDKNGQNSFSAVKLVESQLASRRIRIYPVPSSGNILTFEGVTDYNNNEVSIINTSGSILFHTSLHSQTLRLPTLFKGLYVIQIRNTLSGKIDNLNYIKL